MHRNMRNQIESAAHGVIHRLNRGACYLELAKEHTHTQTACTQETNTSISQSQVYFHLYVRVHKQTLRVCASECVCYAQYGSDAFSGTPCEFQFQSQQRNNQIALPKLANRVREKPPPHHHLL